MTASVPACHACAADGVQVFLTLDPIPLVDDLVEGDPPEADPTFPVRLGVCSACGLVQMLDRVPRERLYGERFRYLSSVSSSWVAHADALAARLVRERGLGGSSRVLEIASNDGYLLQGIVRRGVPALGVEPAPVPAAAARAAGIPTVEAFFGEALARDLVRGHGAFDAIVANNVVAHADDLNDLIGGMAIALREGGVVVIEVPWLMDLIERCAFDTIYHEHIAYFSVRPLARLLGAHGLHVRKVEPLPTHGGSIRAWATKGAPSPEAIAGWLADEEARGLADPVTLSAFGDRVRALVRAIRERVLALRAEGLRIAAYGAAAKGVALLGAAGLGRDEIEVVVDRNPAKQGLRLPGSRLPIADPRVLEADPPDVVLVLPWNLREEIAAQLAPLRARGVRLLFPVPEPELI